MPNIHGGSTSIPPTGTIAYSPDYRVEPMKASTAIPPVCAECGQPITGPSYHFLNGRLTCPSCSSTPPADRERIRELEAALKEAEDIVWDVPEMEYQQWYTPDTIKCRECKSTWPMPPKLPVVESHTDTCIIRRALDWREGRER